MIIETIKKKKIDIINFYNQEYLTALPALFIKKKTKIPIVVTVNGLPGFSWEYGNPLLIK